MTQRVLLGVLLAFLVAAAAIVFVAARPGVAKTPPATSVIAAPAPPSGVDPSRWVPLSSTAGVELGPEPGIRAPGVIRTGELWVLVANQWQIVRLPSAPSPSGFGAVPAASS